MTQAQALAILKTGANVFLTGEPGSGKSYVVNQYVHYLQSKGIAVAVTASTGIAATHIGGMTIHSWSGVGIRRQLTSRDLLYLTRNQRFMNRVQKAKVLIIDEVSMLDAAVLEVVDQALRVIRNTDRPFGGLQVVMVGDFFQLPPVPDESRAMRFAFESEAWKDARLVVCYLAEQHRQMETAFSAVLRAIRSGNGRTAYSQLSQSNRVAPDDDHLTRLYTHNVDVDQINVQKLQQLGGREQIFSMASKGRKTLVAQLKKGCLSPEVLFLKKGAQVMFTKNNFELGFVNGTLGEVVDFKSEAPVVRTRQGRVIEAVPMDWEIRDDDKVLASVSQVPLRLAWAITVHKSQGMTLDAAVVDLSASFEYGQGYVAVSRVRSLKGLYLLGMNERALEVHPRIVEMDAVFKEQSVAAVGFLGRYSQEDMLSKHQQFVQQSGGGSGAGKRKLKSESTYEKTLELYKMGKSVGKIAEERGFVESTIVKHLEVLKAHGKLTGQELLRILPKGLEKLLPEIYEAMDQVEDGRLSLVSDALHGRYSYDELRLARMVRENDNR